MSSNWHHAFNPQSFLKRVKLESLLKRNDAYADNRIEKLGKPCLSCGGSVAPGLLLNEGSYLCAVCFDRLSLIQYPERYEKLWRNHLIALEARRKARQELIRNSPELAHERIVNYGFWFSFLLCFIQVGFIVVPVALFLIARYFHEKHNKALNDWERQYPEPSAPAVRHFHDPAAELTRQDRATLYIFNHWPGYPPFWGYLREVVLRNDNGRCQVSGCPSRLELHIHHIKPVSEGGEHSPENLVSLCDFHHALEPDKGHERIWGNIKTRYFTLVCEHERSNRVSSGSHSVCAHLRRLQLVSLKELHELRKTYGFSCPQCQNFDIKFTLPSGRNMIEVSCPTCEKSVEGPQELTEETGPRLAELLRVTRNHGRWPARWDMLMERRDAVWGDWKGSRATRRRSDFKKRVEQDLSKPICPECGAPMRLIRPRPSDGWKPFWGCTQYRVTGCRGSSRFSEAEH